MKVVILGAGASFGCQSGIGVTPPLVSGFFSGVVFDEISERYEALFDYLSEEGIEAADGPNIEEIFGKVSAIWEMAGVNTWEEVAERYGKSWVGMNPVDRLLQFIADTILTSTQWLENKTCPYHDALVQKWLEEGDTIVSFNYDTIIEASLKRSGRWRELSGYGFLPRTGHGGELRMSENDYSSSYNLLKPHGSINWFKDKIPKQFLSKFPNPDAGKSSIHILSVNHALAGYTRYNEKEGALAKAHESADWLGLLDKVFDFAEISGEEKEGRIKSMSVNLTTETAIEQGYLPLLVTPTPNKNYRELCYAEMSDVWHQVRASLEQADEILIIGFSLQDAHFNSWLRAASRVRKSPPKVTIVDISPQVAQRLSDSKIPNLGDSDFIEGGIGDFVSTL